MGRNLDPKCKQCRREGAKLFLKGDRCSTSKCAIVKRNYPPGLHGAKGNKRLTGYGTQLREKQKAKRIYNILEKQFRNYFEKAVNQKGNTGEELLKFLELRLDNVVYLLGFAKSRNSARQVVCHGHILVNDKKVDIPSYQLKVNDVISVSEKASKNIFFKDLSKFLQKRETVKWILLDAKELKGKIIEFPKREDLKQPIDLKLIVEFYSR